MYKFVEREIVASERYCHELPAQITWGNGHFLSTTNYAARKRRGGLADWEQRGRSITLRSPTLGGLADWERRDHLEIPPPPLHNLVLAGCDTHGPGRRAAPPPPPHDLVVAGCDRHGQEGAQHHHHHHPTT